MIGRLCRMTTHRAPRNTAATATAATADSAPPVERALMIGLILAVIAGFGWIGGMLYTVFG